MTAQDFMQHYFFFVFPIFFVCLWLFICAMISYAGGWSSLAQVFRAQFPFTGTKWRLQSGRMRWAIGYNNCLDIGADPLGLYLAVFPFVRFMHPPLLIPWSQIKVRRGKSWLWGESVTFTLGFEAAVPLRVSGNLAARLRSSAGSSWPVEETL